MEDVNGSLFIISNPKLINNKYNLGYEVLPRVVSSHVFLHKRKFNMPIYIYIYIYIFIYIYLFIYLYS